MGVADGARVEVLTAHGYSDPVGVEGDVRVVVWLEGRRCELRVQAWRPKDTGPMAVEARLTELVDGGRRHLGTHRLA